MAPQALLDAEFEIVHEILERFGHKHPDGALSDL